MLYMRPRRIGGENKIPFHLPDSADDAHQYMHYLRTMCRKELKTVYRNWEIVDNPPVKMRCPECEAAWKKRMTLKK